MLSVIFIVINFGPLGEGKALQKEERWPLLLMTTPILEI